MAFILFIFINSLILSACANKPNIIIILADDLGWNDVGFHGSNQIPTPNIDALAYSGVILNNYYTMPVCSPSRAALMTGRHPIHTGMQHRTIFANEPWGLSLREKLLPEYLNEEGYISHAVGKWHLGHFHKEYTPTYRGFHSHFGYWSGRQDYYDHTAQESLYYWGYDMRRNMNVSYEARGKYTTTLLADEAVRLIELHNTENPMFLYLAHLAVHSGNPYLPLQAPPDPSIMKQFEYIKDPQRRTFATMLTMLDRSVGAVTSALNARGMLENSIIIFSTDNGGPAGGFNLNAASNWPLRGTKDSMWEGGMRGAALIWSPHLTNTPRVSTQLAHIQDWLPTILHAINASTPLLAPNIDGIDIWDALNDPNKQTYRELLLAIDNKRGINALRIGKWKIFHGTIYDGEYDRVIEPSGREGEYDIKAVQESETANAIANTSRPLPSEQVIMLLRAQAEVVCKKENVDTLCHPLHGETCLFDVVSDPCESINLASSHPSVLSYMQAALQRHNSTVVPARNRDRDPKSNPKYWGYTWTNWKDFPSPPHLL